MEMASGNKDYNIYRDIQLRTGGEIYIGIVGPVRTGKSTFIKRFMDIMVLPFMEDENSRARTIDELPQSAQGRTIMTTEPKFIPKDAASIRLDKDTEVKVRLIDCVGYMVDGAAGHMEGNNKRMVKTPWFDYEIPFVDAASIGTQKVIKEHSTIGIVVTTDGSIGELARENYIPAEEKTIEELKTIGKPFVIVLNSEKPYSEETIKLSERMMEKYQTPVISANCEQLRKEDINKILESILYEFPMVKMEFYIPKWAEMLPESNRMKESIIENARNILNHVTKAKDIRGIEELIDSEYIAGMHIDKMDLAKGLLKLKMDMEEKYYYENISELTGVPIDGEYQLISMIKELAAKKNAFAKVEDAVNAVQMKGYGVIHPELTDIVLEEPELIRHGNKFGVKLKATSPSVHLIRANIETEIAPIVGSEEQAKDLINYIKEGQNTPSGVWETNIFGKSVGELMEDGIKSKIAMMDDECQMKLQDTMQKIVNDSNGGLVCIII
ncbi:MAG: stage IV sporulation protein A [Lachnospiraceae bacterium]|nr:stage IV sporulation protein A [Lachnospiraceae bacterium]